MIGIGAVVVVGAVVGSGFVANNVQEQRARISATAAMADARDVDHAQLGAYAGIAEAKAHAKAEETIAAATATLDDVNGKVDDSELAASVASLGQYKELPVGEIVDRAERAEADAAQARSNADAYDHEQAERAAEARAAANTVAGARSTARSLAASDYGWGEGEFQCLDNLWQKESGWSYTAYNPSGATGIPQALPGSKMASAGSDWATNATTQVAWGLGYIAEVYGNPCSAWGHSQALNWY